MSRIDEDAIATHEGASGPAPASEPPEPSSRSSASTRPVAARSGPGRSREGASSAWPSRVAGLTSTPLFHAKSIAVEGERHFSERQVLRIAGIDHDTNVFRLDEGAVRRRLERDPWIANAIVSTDLPSTISISVLERVPVAVALTAEDGRQLIAADGTPLGVAAAGSALPEVRLVGEPGQPGPAFDAVAAGAGVAGGMPPAIRLQVELVVIGSDGTITLHLTDGVTVTYGGPDEFEAKAEAIAAILAYADDQGRALMSIDVTAPAAPTARFVGSTVEVSPSVETPVESPSPTPSASADPDADATP